MKDVELTDSEIFSLGMRWCVLGEDDKEDYYLNERGFLLRLGVGKLQLGDNTMTWEEARDDYLAALRLFVL